MGKQKGGSGKERAWERIGRVGGGGQGYVKGGTKGRGGKASVG